MSTTTRLVPPRRLGTLLRQARVASGLELAELAGDSELSLVELDDIEHGRGDLDAVSLTELTRLYGVDDSGLVPDRTQLIIDLDEGRIAVSPVDVDVDVDVASGPDAILTRYLALVYRLRDLPVGTPLRLRDVDLDVLSSALAVEAVEVEHRLRRLIDDESEVARDQRRIRRQLVIPLAGVVIAATSIGTLVLVTQGDIARPPDAVATVVGTGSVGVGDAAVAEAVIASPELGGGAAVTDNVAGPADVETDIGIGGVVIENPQERSDN